MEATQTIDIGNRSEVHEAVERTEHADGPATSIVRRGLVRGDHGVATIDDVIEGLVGSIHHIDEVTATHDIILSTLGKGEGGIPKHVGTIVLDETGVFTKHDVETLTSGGVDSIAREPTHTVLADVSRIVDIIDIGGYTEFGSSTTQFVDRSVVTHLETTGIALGLSVVIAHLKNRAASPFGSIAGEDNTNAGELGHIIEVKRLVTEVIHSLTDDRPVIVSAGENGANAAEAVEYIVASHIIAIAETRMEGECGDKAVRSPTTRYTFKDLETVDTNTGGDTIGREKLTLEIVLINIILGVADLTSSSGEDAASTSSKLGTRAHPVLHPVIIIVAHIGQPRSFVVLETNVG